MSRYFRLVKKSKRSSARRGILYLKHGVVKTPLFMPIATLGVVKTLSFDDLKQLDAQMILANTYHLMIRPGINLIEKAGDLSKFIHWDRPILTDSGGFQVFSLAKIRKISNQGVRFSSVIDGKTYLLTPEKAIKIQDKLNSDIIMVLDECVKFPSSYQKVKEAVERTTRWAKRCLKVFQSLNSSSLLFGIIQGGLYKSLREKSREEIVRLNFDGYAIGGLAVGEPEKERKKVLDYLVKELPEDKPRYLMGLGKPEQILQAIRQGVDMFDCVIPTREARHGRLYQFISNKINFNKDFYQTINIQNEKYKKDFSPINPFSKIEILKKYSKAYLRHLFLIKEPLSLRLATLNNLEFYLDLMKIIRKMINKDKL